MKTKTTCIFILLFSFSVSLYAAAPVRVIFDTDLATDCDDAGALAVLHALADAGQATILAMGVSTVNPYSILALDAINTWYGRPAIPIGTTKAADAYKPDPRSLWYVQQVAEEYPRNYAWKSCDDAPDAVAVYRKVLAAEPDIDAEHPGVVLITVGMLTNSRDLLESKPCTYSPLTGPELVKKKVRLWVFMGGRFQTKGGEYNITMHAEGARYALAHWPTPIVLSPFEIGHTIVTGTGLQPLPGGPGPEGHLLRRIYELYGSALTKGRYSWDQTAVLYGVEGIDGGPATDYWELSSPGRVTVSPAGASQWNDDPGGQHRYLIEKRDPNLIAEEIETLMLDAPAGKQD